MIWVGEAIALTVFAWLGLVVAHQYRLDHPRCPRCRRVQLSALDGRLHQIACPFPASGSEPARFSADRAGALETSKSRHR